MEDKKENNQDGYVKDRSITVEMETSYLDYAMSVIVARALPDVRDGLKPVHRRVLFSMYEMGLMPSGKFRKSATVVGEVLGKYHPHGDVAVYDTLVRMAQDFAMRYPLVSGQGNFGSVDGDTAAAMRYTECKLSKIAIELLSDIEKNTVDWNPNYDNTRKEPKVLPAKIPNLLVNGTVGIAVGMATNIPPHNLKEVISATIRLIDNPEATNEELLLDISGPDFPTGGEIYDFEEIKNAYATGKGRITMRAKAEIEEKKDGYFRIKVLEIPYQVNKATLIEKIADLVKIKRIVGIAGIRDESDKEGTRIVIDLKKDAYAKKILNQLFKLTQMQETFHMNMVALVDGVQPKLLTLRDVLSEYILHRQKVVEKRTKFELKVAQDRHHVVDGLLIALSSIDKVIDTIKKSADKPAAAKALEEKFKLSAIQASAILEMRLSNLAALERKKLEFEAKKLKETIKYLTDLLADPKKILKVIKDELSETMERFGDERKTRVIKSKIDDFSQEDLIPNEEVIVTLTKGNYIKRLPVNTYRAQARGGKGVVGVEMKEEDTVRNLLFAKTHDDILCFTNLGRVFKTKVYEIPTGSRHSKGQAIVNLLQLGPSEFVTGIINFSKKSENTYLIMATKKGLIKRTAISEYENIRKTGIIAMGLKSDDEMHWVSGSKGESQILMATKTGKSIRFSENDARSMGRTAFGIRGIRLDKDDELVGMDVFDKKNIQYLTVLIVLDKGLGKRTRVANYPLQKRAGTGVKTARITDKTGSLIGMKVVKEDGGELLAISKNGQVIKMPLKSVKLLGRSTSGVRLIRLNAGDNLAAISVIQNGEEDLDEKTQIENSEIKSEKSKKVFTKIKSKKKSPKKAKSQKKTKVLKKIKKPTKKK